MYTLSSNSTLVYVVLNGLYSLLVTSMTTIIQCSQFHYKKYTSYLTMSLSKLNMVSDDNDSTSKHRVSTWNGEVAGYRLWKQQVVAEASRQNLKFPKTRLDRTPFDVAQIHHAATELEAVPLTAATLILSALFVAQGYVEGDLPLAPNRRLKYIAAKEQGKMNEQKLISLIYTTMQRSCQADTIIRAGFENHDVGQMWFDLDDYYEGELVHILLSIVF